VSPRNIDPRLASFVAPGSISVTTLALNIARAFFEQIRQEKPNEDWIVTFDWAVSRRVRKPRGGEWQDLGAGLDITAYRRQQIPQGVIQKLEGVEIAFKIPEHVLEQSRDKRIDIDPSGAPRVRLV